MYILERQSRGARSATRVRGAPHSLTPRFVRTNGLHDRARIRCYLSFSVESDSKAFRNRFSFKS